MSQTYRVDRGETYAGYTDLTVLACPTCGVLYAIPEKMRAEAHKLGDWELMWCCPNGHQVGFGESEAQKLKRKLENERARSGQLASRLEQEQAHARAQKSRGTRFKNQRDRERGRVAHGVCPCCNRHFKALARHMKSQHPEFAVPDDS